MAAPVEPVLVDSHNHFDDAGFDDDRDAAYQRARAAGVTTQVLAAVSARLWPGLRAVVARYPGLHACYGLHPAYLAEHRPEHLAHLAEWLARERPVAIGECGLDYYLPDLDPELQLNYFSEQLRLARHHDLPVVIHARHAVDAVIKQVRRFPGVRGVVHSFSGSAEQAAQLHRLGFLLGIGGPVTYERAARLRGIVAGMPLEQLLLETDSPDQPGAAHRGQRNEPAHLVEVLDVVAALRGMPREALAAATRDNAARLFNLPGSA